MLSAVDVTEAEMVEPLPAQIDEPLERVAADRLPGFEQHFACTE